MRNQVTNPEPPNRTKRKSTEDDEDAIGCVVIEMNQHISLTFS